MPHVITPEAVNRWLAEMKATGRAKNKKESAEAIGVSQNGMTTLVQAGADKKVALAMRAALEGLPPYE